MKSLKLTTMLCLPAAVLSLAAVLSGCGASSGEFEAAGTSKISSGTVTTTTVVTATPTPAPTATPAANACGKQVIDRRLYVFPLTGSGTGTAVTETIPANVVDQKLRARLVVKGPTGSKSYTKLGATLKVVRNGVVQSGSTVALPTTTDAQGYKAGIAINAKSEIQDFSSMIQSGATYAIQVSNVMSDYNCNTNLRISSGNYYCYSQPYPYISNCSGYDSNTGTSYTWNWDYHTKAYYCCAGNNLQQSQQQQCGVGTHNTTALNVGWSVQVEVETDTSDCML